MSSVPTFDVILMRRGSCLAVLGRPPADMGEMLDGSETAARDRGFFFVGASISCRHQHVTQGFHSDHVRRCFITSAPIASV